jgi:hypothetical protein
LLASKLLLLRLPPGRDLARGLLAFGLRAFGLLLCGFHTSRLVTRSFVGHRPALCLSALSFPCCVDGIS